MGNQEVLQQISAGQQRLASLENEMKNSKRLMVLLTILALITVILNRNCKNE